METKEDNLEELVGKLLDYREKKIGIIKDLQDKYELPILTLKSNYPGIFKENETTSTLVSEIDKEVEKIYKEKIKFKKQLNTPEGLTIFYIIDDDPFEIKEEAINIEDEHELGRFVDLDAFFPMEEGSISRTHLGFDMRRCYLCNKYATECSRNQSHDYEELIGYIEKILETYLRR